MLKDETTMERALREQKALIMLSEVYKNGRVLHTTQEEASETVRTAACMLKALHELINDNDVIREQIKSSRMGISKPFYYPRFSSVTSLPDSASGVLMKAS